MNKFGKAEFRKAEFDEACLFGELLLRDLVELGLPSYFCRRP